MDPNRVKLNIARDSVEMQALAQRIGLCGSIGDKGFVCTREPHSVLTQHAACDLVNPLKPPFAQWAR